MNKIKFSIFILCISNVACEFKEECRYTTCGACISTSNCVWCADKSSITSDTPRCMPLANLNNKKTAWCPKDSIINPPTISKVTMDKTFEDTIDNVTVQFRPQYISINARPGAIVPITMSYQPAEDFPLDVYYLMDVSYTMKSEKQALEKQAYEIYRQLTSYTNNVKLGIGSFVEKPGFPYVDVNLKQKHVSYAFRNHLSLTKDMKEFTSTINKIEFGANYDDPEAGLDALMQVMTCEKELGWRKGSRRIIVMCTDSTYHSAGDGKVLGAIKPNDMKCHLDNNLYNETMALTYDYPSVSQINRVAVNGHFIIIFAAKRQVNVEYTKLANQISGAQYAALEGGKAAVEIIKKAYKDATESVTLNYDLPRFIQLTLDQQCETKPPRNCKSTPEQRKVIIPANLTVKYCPTDGILEREISVSVVGINDKLTIKLKINCKCDCEEMVSPVTPNCNNAGYLQCGICKCNPGSYGTDCRCNGTSTDSKSDWQGCMLNRDDSKLCSGRGICKCGRCEVCNTGFSGDFCQYDDNSCPQMCNNHGRCRFGKCECDSQWTGRACSCPLDVSACVAPYSKELCSGNGICHCGECKCKTLPGKNETYAGSFCDDCEDCTEKRCKELEKYVVCNVMNEKPLCDKQYNATGTLVEFKNKTELNGPEWHMGKWCKTQLENDSYIIFKYQYDEGTLKLGIQDEVELPAKANIFIAVGSAIGTVLLIGIITLIIWKVLVDIHDKREYQKFSKESQAAGFDVSLNPLYVPATVNFTNLGYDNNCG